MGIEYRSKIRIKSLIVIQIRSSTDIKIESGTKTAIYLSRPSSKAKQRSESRVWRIDTRGGRGETRQRDYDRNYVITDTFARIGARPHRPAVELRLLRPAITPHRRETPHTLNRSRRGRSINGKAGVTWSRTRSGRVEEDRKRKSRKKVRVHATAVYWHIISPKGDIDVSLITAKEGVAPLKVTSVSRIELQAAVLGVRLTRSVVEGHDEPPTRRVYWSDSKTVLTWIRTLASKYKAFVAHRLAETEDDTKTNEWRWVLPTVHNIADVVTREPPEHFDIEHRSFLGPDFLRCLEHDWFRENNDKNVMEPTGKEPVYTVRLRDNTSLQESLRKTLLVVEQTMKSYYPGVTVHRVVPPSARSQSHDECRQEEANKT
ncbi:hypothetical protein EVAR_16480_1 [Eumeta japonica]|uniref:Uncharacterized protein n=1 Tax=Eumeta variegata TaxID=151549 RepID=A0A4C1UKC9_EUMVA|nr:hypothetical protein EVAR_16480_1 [Eumeta japonica]